MSERRARAVRIVATGLHRMRLLGPLACAAGLTAGRGVFQVLSYHRVNDEGDPFFPALPTAVFEEQMTYVAATHTVLTVEDLVERARYHRLPHNAVAITFDDGYRDNLTHAAPILRRLGLPATIFLATGLIGPREVAWFDRLAQALKLTEVSSVRAPDGRCLPLTTASARLRALADLLGQLKTRPDDDLRRFVDETVRALGVPDTGSLKGSMLTWDDVNALMGLGFAIGAHTVSHPVLSRVSLARARAEIETSRDIILSLRGHAPRAFAYPNGGAGDYTDAVRNIVRGAGFTCAVTTRFGVNTAATSPFELRRGGPWERDLPTFALKLTGYRLAGARASQP